VPTISIVNRSTLLTDAHVAPVVAAMQKHLDTAFGPAWGIEAKLVHVPAGQTAAAGTWLLVLLDNSDQADDLGYHETSSEGLPLGKAFVASDQQYGLEWSVTLDHELKEMLVDPWVRSMVRVPAGGQTPEEVCDPVQDDQDAIVVDGVLLSNATLPAYWRGGAGPWDLSGVLTGPFPTLARGGYMMVSNGGDWHGVYGEATPHDRGRLERTRSRLYRRALPREQWRRSTAV
jgi:hypothetical protein